MQGPMDTSLITEWATLPELSYLFTICMHLNKLKL